MLYDVASLTPGWMMFTCIVLKIRRQVKKLGLPENRRKRRRRYCDLAPFTPVW